jgi:hypothetical protein
VSWLGFEPLTSRSRGGRSTTWAIRPDFGSHLLAPAFGIISSSYILAFHVQTQDYSAMIDLQYLQLSSFWMGDQHPHFRSWRLPCPAWRSWNCCCCLWQAWTATDPGVGSTDHTVTLASCSHCTANTTIHENTGNCKIRGEKQKQNKKHTHMMFRNHNHRQVTISFKEMARGGKGGREGEWLTRKTSVVKGI